MQTEGPFWRNTVKPQFDRLGLFYKRIESPISPGFCDTIILYKTQTTLLELKSRDKIEPRFGLNPLQKIFVERWNFNGGYAYILTRIGKQIYLLQGNDVPDKPTEEDLHSRTLQFAPSREFDWNIFLLYLYRPS